MLLKIYRLHANGYTYGCWWKMFSPIKGLGVERFIVLIVMLTVEITVSDVVSLIVVSSVVSNIIVDDVVENASKEKLYSLFYRIQSRFPACFPLEIYMYLHLTIVIFYKDDAKEIFYNYP